MTKKYIIKGLVQGIGYRPFVAKIADELNIDGWVRNTGGIVTVMASGEEDNLQSFYDRLSDDIPTGGFISSIEIESVLDTSMFSNQGSEIISGAGFRIVESDQDVELNLPLIPADIASCDECKKELLNKDNRRYLHPFISCTVCGPRYSIIKKLPYDRDTITMGDFGMCEICHTEYTAKLDRRRHAQTIACKQCGPKLDFALISGKLDLEIENANAGKLAKSDVHRNFTSEFLENLKNDFPELFKAAMCILNGGIVAIKDIGGYHLACNPFDYVAVNKLRLLKHREAKAFAVMFYDADQVKEYCYADEQEIDLIETSARPIVLLNRKSDVIKPLAENVCLTSPSIGAMLPSNPVQIILAKACGPLIMTSANASGDVLETDDDKMKMWLEERAISSEMTDATLAMLSHDRMILRPMDDSVMKLVRGRQQFIRRARGHVPNPISVDIKGELFAAGGDLKSSFCYVKNGLAYPSQYLGDMESVSCQSFYKNEKRAMKEIFGFSPEIVAIDKHPGYFSRKINANNLYEVQHHKAHVASVIAEHNLKGTVLGFAFDGTGYGDDGTIWGSEAFLWNGRDVMERIAHLAPTKLIGGNEGAKNCDTILASFIHAVGLDEEFKTLHSSDKHVDDNNLTIINAALDNNINVVTSTSMGRLFDAVSALLDICHYNSYEGQAPIELENIAANVDKGYRFFLSADGDVKELFKNIMQALTNGVDKAQIARGFIEAIADYIVSLAVKYEARLDDNKQIVLSGGTFLNRILLEKTIDELETRGFKVYIAEQLPPGDGGICLGQAYLASRQYAD